MPWTLSRRRRTPWIDLPLSNGWTGRLMVRRVGDTVWVKTEALDGSASTGTVVATLPLGYRSEAGTAERGLLAQADAGTPVLRRWWAQGGAYSVAGGTSAAVLYGSASWDTTDPMPAGGV